MPRRIKVPSRFEKLMRKIIPQKWIKKYDAFLYTAGIEFLATEFLVLITIISGMIGIAFAILKPIYGPIGFLASLVAIGGIYPYWKISKRIEDMERNLPDAFFYLASSLRAGIAFTEALEEVTMAKFGALSEEFKKTVSEIKKGRPTIEALRAFAFRNKKSPVIYRSMMILIEALDRGAPMAEVLVNVGNDVREILRIKRERKSSTGMQTMFFTASSGFIGPLILGIVFQIIGALTTAGTGLTLPVEDLDRILRAFVIVQAVVSGVGIGVIREGKFSTGLKYSIMLAIMAAFIYNIAKNMQIGI